MDYTHFCPTKTAAWQHLKEFARRDPINIQQQFKTDPGRVADLSITCDELLLDFSKNLIDRDIWQQLIALAEQSPLAAHRSAMFNGESINTSEDRAVLHTALRSVAENNPANEHLGNALERAQRATDVHRQRQQLARISDKIRAGEWLGSTGKTVTDVVNIGIGGSDLGPKLACQALAEYAQPNLNMHFIANVDGAEILTTLGLLNAETTLITVASKTFTTQETLLNANTAIDWFENRLGLANAQTSSHFIAITASRDNARAFGIDDQHILDFSDWVGGRYSLWSSIGLSIAISIGSHNFDQMLAGAAAMDDHFLTAPLNANMPVALALLGIWYSNFLRAQSHAVIPYCERLNLLPSYLQQLDMESNGKSTRLNGQPVDYSTGPILWGQTGTNGQHAFFQLLHQGTHCIPVDFIAVADDALSNPTHHRVLLGNMLAQGSALMTGQSAAADQPHRHYPGNKPSNTLLMDRLTAKNFGALIALYEHKVFVQGSLWNINSFDQWGVELGKKMAAELLGHDTSKAPMDASTAALYTHLQKITI